jgi:hypothetical protein
MADTNITSADAVFSLSIPGLFPAPVILSGYSAERAWASDGVDLAETSMGVDGRMTGGFTPNPVKQTISLQADSPSKVIFGALAAAMKANKQIYYINATIVLPGPQEAYSLVRGILQNYKAIADAGKVLAAVDYVIMWQQIDGSIV